MKKMIAVLLALGFIFMGLQPSAGLTQNYHHYDATLASLEVSKGTLSPSFSSRQQNYKVTLPASTINITITAIASSRYAKVSGTGSFALSSGKNTFPIKVISGSKSLTKTYQVVVIVGESTASSDAQVVYKGKNYTIASSFNDVSLPSGFLLSTTKINQKEVLSLYNKTADMMICFLKNKEGKGSFYIVKEGKITAPFQTVTLADNTYILADASSALKKRSGYSYGKIDVEGQSIKGWRYDDSSMSHYLQLYLIGDDGKASLYQYETTQKTLQKYKEASSLSGNDLFYIVLIAFLLCLLMGLGIAYLYFKRVRIDEIKAYYKKRSTDS